MLTCLVLVLSVLLMAGHASAQEPEWLKDARAREGRNLQAQAVRSADGFFTGVVTAARVMNDEIVADDGVYQIDLDIGGETPATCEVIADGVDLAGVLRQTADMTVAGVSKMVGTVDRRAIERTDAGVYGASPYLALDWLFRVNDGTAARVGALKQVVVSTRGRTLYCAHLDLGYSKSFQGAVRSLAESLRFEAAAEDPYFVEISTATVRGQKIGVAVVTMERDADGDTRVVTSASFALPVTPDTLQTQDTNHVQWVRPDGSLISAAHLVSANGELETELDLMPTDDGWLVEGTFEGKAIETRLAATPAPTTLIRESRALRELFGTSDVVGAQRTTAQWSTADPTRFIESQTTILSVVDDDHLAARESVEGISADVVLERTTGLPSRSVIELGPVSIELERVHVQGGF